MCHDVRGCGDGVCVCTHLCVPWYSVPVCVNSHVVAFPKKRKKEEGQERFLNIIYLHVVNNQKLDGGKICERD